MIQLLDLQPSQLPGPGAPDRKFKHRHTLGTVIPNDAEMCDREPPAEMEATKGGDDASRSSALTAAAPPARPQPGRRQGAPLVCRMQGCTQQLRRSYNQVGQVPAQEDLVSLSFS
jgi:hypothetical protein